MNLDESHLIKLKLRNSWTEVLLKVRQILQKASYYQRREGLVTCASYVVGAENALVNMLACLKKLKTYQVTMFPMTNKIVEAMATNNDRHLERFSFKAKMYASPINPDVSLSTDYISYFHLNQRTLSSLCQWGI